MIRAMLAVLLISLSGIGMAFAVPQCDEIFTDPPTGNHHPNGLVHPDDIGPDLGNLTCGRNGCSGHSASFTPGDYDFRHGSFGNKSFLSTNGATTRLYFDSLSMNNASLNRFGETEDLIIYVRGSLSVAGQNYINGIVYVAGSVTLTGNASIDGALASGGSLNIGGNGDVGFDDDAIEDADFGGMCDNNSEPVLPVVPLQCPAEQVGIAGITYRTYDTGEWKPGQYTSPVDHDDFNDLLDTVKTTTNQLGESIEPRIDGYGVSINPHSSQGDNYVGVFEGYIDVPETGKYTFGIDGDDAIELLIDDQVVVGFYGLHGQCGSPCRTGDIGLAAGTHKVELRFHEATGAEAYHLYWQPPSASSLVLVPDSAYLTCPFPQFEFGRVTLNDSGSAIIQFENSYATAPVIMLMPTINGANSIADGPSTVRLVSSSAGAATIVQNDPPSNRVPSTSIPEVDYFIMEAGYRFLAQGSALQAGKVETGKYQGKRLASSGRGYEEIDFRHKFGAQPAMVGQTLSRENNRFITTVINDVDTEGDEFEIAIEASELSGAINQDEILGYVAGLGSGSILVDGESILYEFGYASNHNGGNSTRNLTQQCAHPTLYENNYVSQPYVVASKNSRRGADGGWIRRCRHDSFNNTVSFGVDEDQQLDAERSHLAEDIGYFAFEAEAEPPATNHYRIQFSSDALSCTAKEITIKSCANEDCSTLSSIESSVELYKGDVKYSDVSIKGETDTPVWHGEGGLTTLGLGATSPSGPYFCYIDDKLVDNTACSLNFAEAGFIVNIDNFLANKPQDNVEITAVKKSDSSPQCEPTFASTSKVVNFWSEYVSPTPADMVSAKSISVNETNIGKSALNATPFTLAFDSQGKAKFKLNYADAGKIALHAKYTALPGDDDEGLVMEGSGNTVRYPVGLCIKPEKTCTAGDASCGAFKVAGDTFDVSIQAMAWEKDGDTDFCNNLTTPNYVQADIPLKHILKQPSAGVLGELSLDSYSHDANANSLNELELSISEVGVFSLKATPPTNDYLGEAITVTAAESKPIGRFYPNDFAVYDESMIASCDGVFSYMDEPVTLMMKIRARNLSGDTTKNYFGDFASGSGLLVGEDSNAGVNYQARLSDLPSLDWSQASQGVENINSNIQFSRLLNSATDGPYTSMAIGLQMNDADSVKIAAADMNAGTIGDCATAASCNAKELTIQHYRHGRITLENAYGPEDAILRMPATAEFWNGAQWAVNTLDNCSAVASILPTAGVIYNPALDGSQAVTRNGGTTFGLGRFELQWQSLVATPNRYRGQVTAPLEVPLWLQWYWNWEGDGALSDPRASAFFGTYRGHDKVIHWREVN
ncbi:DUF6701 domain-containing protein [Shewanella sp. UCD-KL12]|uniref:DUF6701 domain-containing protein n=1 Tax=Shewanella sp. UCD-KL12 TaxID=1917163 RepID=UPI0009FA00CE|nr:DUF6701 domain-containing protein [Shewanella sp. UCD-KL12]